MKRNGWSVEELEQILGATTEANANADYYLAFGTLSEENAALMKAYRQGFKAALGSIARAVGVPVSVLEELEGHPVREVVSKIIHLIN